MKNNYAVLEKEYQDTILRLSAGPLNRRKPWWGW